MGYRYLQPEQFGWLDSVYMTVITITTVGYGEVHALTPQTRAWTLAVIVSGVVTSTVVVSLIVAMVVEGQVRNIVGRRNVEKTIASIKDHVIVCGFGRMGRLVAEELVEGGREVVVVDVDPERANAAERMGLPAILGNALEEEVLESAGLQRAAVLVATLHDDADNVYVTLSGRQANNSIRIVARAQQSATAPMLQKAGATRVVCPQVIGATRMADVVMRPAVVDFVEMAHRGVELEMDQLELPAESWLVGKTLRELSLPSRVGGVVVAVLRASGEAVYHPTPELELQAGDTVVLVGKEGIASSVQQLEAESK